MSGGDFVNSGERARLLQRGIEDRVKLVGDLRKVMDAHGAESAALMLGSWGVGELFGIVERRAAIQAPLLEQLYGPRGGKLRPGLADCAKAKDFVDMPLGGVSKILAAPVVPVVPGSAPAVAVIAPPAHVPQAVPAKPPTAAEAAVLHATLKRAVVVCGSNKKAAEAIGIGWSTIGFLLGKQKPITAATAEKVRAWDAANPQNASAGDADRGPAMEAPAAVTVLQDAATVQPEMPSLAGDTAGETAIGVTMAEPFEQNSTPALAAAAQPPAVAVALPCAGVDGAVVLASPPPQMPAPIAANDDPFALAVTGLITPRDKIATARTALLDAIAEAGAAAVAAIARRDELLAQDAALMLRWSKLETAVLDLQDDAR